VADLDPPRLALYVALGVVVCFLGARYVGAQVHGAAASGAGTGSDVASASASASAPPRAAAARPEPEAAPDASVSVGRAGGGRVIVHVAGAVRRPGVYRFAAGARVNDALRRAGGARAHADLDAVNLAAKLEDGRQILVPRRGAAAGSGGPAAAGSSAAGPPDAPAAPVNLNTATLEQLDTLDGVGPGIAKRILDYREQHGGFSRVEQLGEVPGIGAKRLATLTPLVTV
jgi:competence protein ComEA